MSESFENLANGLIGPSDPSASARRAFLRAMLPNPLPANTVLYVSGNCPLETHNGKGLWREAPCASIEDAAALIDDDAGRAEMYVTLACFTPGGGRKLDAVVARDWLSVDIDDKVMPGAIGEERHENARRLAASIPCIHVVIDSGGGFHVHLRLPQGHRIQDFAKPADGIRHVELLGRAFRLFLEQKHRELFNSTDAVRLDHCHGPERVWRVPPGINCKALGDAKTLTADPSKWRPVKLVLPAQAEGIEGIPAADLSFLDPFLMVAQREIEGAQDASAANSESSEPTDFDPSVLPTKLQATWPMVDGDQSRHDFAVAAALAKLGFAQNIASAAIRARRAQLPRAEDRAKTAREDYVIKTVHNAYSKVGPRIPTTERSPPLPPFRPFPVDALPEPIRSFVIEGAAALGCDPSYIALPLLAALAAAVGNSRRIGPKRGWSEPSVLWTVVVGWSGTLKSPAIDLAVSFLKRRQIATLLAHEIKAAEYQIAKTRYDADLADWKKRREGPLPQAPVEPVVPRLFCSDITVEALADRLKDSPRGLLLIRDELAGWLKSFDAYRQGRGGDDARWLEMHRAGTLVVDRKSGTPLLYVPYAAVSVTGGIQPEALRNALGIEHFSNGLAARLLLALPPRQRKKWSDAEVRHELLVTIDRVFERLLALALVDGKPVELSFTEQGRAAFINFYNEHAKEQNDRTGDLAAAWSKLEGYAARLALIVHLIRVVADDGSVASQIEVDEQSVAAGVRLVRWFAYETERVYAVLGDSPATRNRRELVDLIRDRGGEITARALMRASQRYRSGADAAVQALEDLVTGGFGGWIEIPTKEQGGRPTRTFRLFPSGQDDDSGDETPIARGTTPVLSLSPPPTSISYGAASAHPAVQTGESAICNEGTRPFVETPEPSSGDGDTTGLSPGRENDVSPKPRLADPGTHVDAPFPEERPTSAETDSSSLPASHERPAPSPDLDALANALSKRLRSAGTPDPSVGGLNRE